MSIIRRDELAFEEQFASEEACRAYWIEVRWNGQITCQRCGGRKGLAVTRRQVIRLRSMQASDEPDRGQPAGRNANRLRPGSALY